MYLVTKGNYNNKSINNNNILIYSLLDEKRKEIGDQANKLSSGLDKLIDTREKVQAMSVELEDAKIKVADYQKQCEDYLVIIVQQKRDAEEQEKVRELWREKEREI